MPTSSEKATADMIQRWRELASRIASASDVPRERSERPVGELFVLGSGFAHPDVLLADEARILAADVVFHCLYDRVTQIWINGLRPDALDLRILYDPSNDRNDTYVCMAEAMLYCVRQGQRVVAVFYGHPGMFATPTHRAVRIARREGFRATMRPGISALDYLVADVGFDPMLPGLISYEATDLILRDRRLDPTLHTVIWQVGAVGEFRYSPAGFANQGFPLLVRRLTDAYGADGEVVHYVAPQYVGVEPLVERHRLCDLLDEAVATRISALSTFYLPPQERRGVDPAAAISLGYHASVDDLGGGAPPSETSVYGDREMKALGRFSAFRADESYRMPGASPVADFMLALSRDPELLARYEADAAGLLSSPLYAALTARARKLLEIKHPMAINAALAES